MREGGEGGRGGERGEGSVCLSLTRPLWPYLHAKGLHSGGHFSANPAQTHDTKSLSFQLHTHVLCRDEHIMDIRHRVYTRQEAGGTMSVSHTFFLSHSPSLME